MNKKILIIICIALCNIVFIHAQTIKKPDSKFALWFGVRNYEQLPLNSTSNIDFFDYYLSNNWENTTYKANYEYLGISYLNKWNDKVETDLRITVDPSFTPNTFFARGTYYPNKFLGLAFTYYACPQLLNDYAPYFENNSTYKNMNSRIITDEWPQWSIYDHNLSIGAVSPLNFGDAHLKLGVHAGLIFLSAFNTSIFLSDNTSNYQTLIDYRFTASTTAFINPEVSLEFDIHEFNGKAIGLQLQASALYAKRSINYKQTQYEWTMDSPTTQKIIGATHSFKKIEFDAGLFYKW